MTTNKLYLKYGKTTEKYALEKVPPLESFLQIQKIHRTRTNHNV